MANFRCLMIGAELTADGVEYERDAESRHTVHIANWSQETLTDSQRYALQQPIERRRPYRSK